ncbi:MAG: hypothetical protein ACRD03_01850 [Acidimicrobiales bacterium]
MAFLAVPDFPALLQVLDDRGIRYTVNPNGDDWLLEVDAPAGAIVPEIRMAIRRHKWLLIWTVIARGTGHVWAPCNVCGEAVLLDPAPRLAGKTVWPTCRLTPGCTGRHTTT